MKHESIFITGANRGIGLAIVKRLVASNDPPRLLFATYRNPATLQDLKSVQASAKKTKVVLIKLDVNNPDEIGQARQIVEETVGSDGLSLLINNAAYLESVPFDQVTAENVEKHLLTNTIAPLMMIKALLPILEKSPRQKEGPKSTIVNISSLRGSIENSATHEYDFYMPSYKISKAGLNMMSKFMGMLLRDRGVLVVSISTGWCRTDMGDNGLGIADLSPDESASAIVQTLGELKFGHQGNFIDRFGKPIAF